MLPPLTIETTLGTLVVELFEDRMPVSCARFRSLAAEGFYDGTHLHRVSPALVQGGCPFSRDLGSPHVGTGGSPKGPFPDERPNGAQLANDAGTLGFTPSTHRDSADCQFFLNAKDNHHLDWWRGGNHAVFGRVVRGLDVLQRIAASRTSGRIAGERPLTPIRVVRVR